MKPETGKWYWITYSKPSSKRHYDGPAICMGLNPWQSKSQKENLWGFCQPDVPERLRENMFVQELYASYHIKKEIPDPTESSKDK